MKKLKIVLHILQDLFVISMFIFSVWGCILMWTDPEYANYMVGMISRTFGDNLSTGNAMVTHKIFLTILLLAFDTFLAFVFVEDNFIKKLKGSNELDK